jgi:hypothetical protein
MKAAEDDFIPSIATFFGIEKGTGKLLKLL